MGDYTRCGSRIGFWPADALGTTPEFWITLQNDVNLWESLQAHKKIRLLPILRRLKRQKRTSQQKQRSAT